MSYSTVYKGIEEFLHFAMSFYYLFFFFFWFWVSVASVYQFLLDPLQFIKGLLNLLGTNHAFISSSIWSALLNVRLHTNQVERNNESTFTLLR